MDQTRKADFTLRQTTELNTVEAQISIEQVLPNMRVYRATLHLPMVAMERLLAHAVRTMDTGKERDLHRELHDEIRNKLSRLLD